jgi:tRNA dimethylallyltransferase
MQKIIVIVGPTAVGKSALAVELARRFNGEIISADSRQVYRGLNIGTGKITKPEMRGIRHHLLDVADPRKQFSAENFRVLGRKAIGDIIARGKLPIVCGGTGFYIQALIDDARFPEVPPNPALRKKLETQTTARLFALLQKKDSRRAAGIDANNRRRLIRALEIVAALGKVPVLQESASLAYDPLFIGLTLPPAELKEKITKRLDARLKHGMITEARRLRANGLSWKRMKEFGLEYRALAEYLEAETTQKPISKAELRMRLEHDIWHYAKRQLTWFKRNKRITWITI